MSIVSLFVSFNTCPMMNKVFTLLVSFALRVPPTGVFHSVMLNGETVSWKASIGRWESLSEDESCLELRG